MRILFLTWGEVPRLSSVYGGQVVEVVAALQQHSEIEHASLVAGYPVIHSGMVREKWRYRDQLIAIQNLLGANNFSTRRIPVPPVGVHPKPWQLPLFIAGHHGFLARKIRAERPDVVHCRSYVATYFALETRARFGMSFKIVFDARSFMPDEAVVAGRWSTEDAAYAFWKAREVELLTEADLSTSVSQPMQDIHDKLGAKRSALIHLNAAVSDLDELRIADVSRIEAGTPVLAYCGYLDERSWHSPTNLWQVFTSFHRHCPGAKLLVITKSDHGMLRESIRSQGIADLLDSISFTSAPTPRATVGLLQDADLSVLSYRNPQNAFEEALAEPVFATKTAEYLSVGLPLLVNRYCGGARDYVLSHDAGLAYDPHKLLSAGDVVHLLKLAHERVRISRGARHDFGLTYNADRWVDLYAGITNRDGSGN